MPRYRVTSQATERKRGMSRAEVLELIQATTTTNPETAAACMGMCRPTFMKGIEDGSLDIRLLRIARNFYVPTSDIARVLGIEVPAPPARRPSSRKPRAAAAG